MNKTTIGNDHNLNEIDFREVFKTILHYKWSILLVSFSTLLMAACFLYFKTPVYMSQALIEVKSDSKKGMEGGDFLGSASLVLAMKR